MCPKIVGFVPGVGPDVLRYLRVVCLREQEEFMTVLQRRCNSLQLFSDLLTPWRISGEMFLRIFVVRPALTQGYCLGMERSGIS